MTGPQHPAWESREPLTGTSADGTPIVFWGGSEWDEDWTPDPCEPVRGWWTVTCTICERPHPCEC